MRNCNSNARRRIGECSKKPPFERDVVRKGIRGEFLVNDDLEVVDRGRKESGYTRGMSRSKFVFRTRLIGDCPNRQGSASGGADQASGHSATLARSHGGEADRSCKCSYRAKIRRVTDRRVILCRASALIRTVESFLGRLVVIVIAGDDSRVPPEQLLGTRRKSLDEFRTEGPDVVDHLLHVRAREHVFDG